MTIGPEPMIKIRLRSVRLGIALPRRGPRLFLHQAVHDRRFRRRLFAAIQHVVEATTADPRDLAAAPELLTEHAHAAIDPLADRVRLERGLVLCGERGPLGLLAASLCPPVRDQVFGHDALSLRSWS